MALGLTYAAIRVKWSVLRSLVGAGAFVFALIALVAWTMAISAMVLFSGAEPRIDSDAQAYIGWDPRGLYGWWNVLGLILLFVGFLAFVHWAGNRYQRQRQRDKG